MAEREVKQWITVNGNHIPIYDGESKRDAYNRAIVKHNEDVKNKQISENQKQASYQGKGQYAKAQSTGVSADAMTSKLSKLSDNVIADNAETIGVLNKIKGNPNATITIYRATVGDTINQGDWIFLDKKHADKWTKTAFGTPKPNTKVVIKKVKAKDVDWTGKNLEFVYNKKQ